MTPFTFNTAPSIVFGDGAVRQLGEQARRRLGERVFIVTDAGVVSSGLVAPAREALEREDLAVAHYAGVVADPPEHIVQEAAATATAFGATGIVGLGGGSSMDVAKLVALLCAGREKLADIYGVNVATGPRLPLILVPTTAGTGSEVTPISIVTTGENEKKGVVSPVLLPDVALLDPELTLGLPPHVTAATGIDAMVHAIEAYASASPNNNPLSRHLAREALRLLGRALLPAVRDGSDREARGAMLLGAMLAGQAFANSPVAAVHALAYPIGGRYHVPHGLSNALVLPHVIRFNAPVAGQSYADIAPDLFPHLGELGTQGRAEAFAEALAGLSPACGLPTRLRDVGIPEEALPTLAEDAMKQTRLLVNNPRPVTEGDVLSIYREAW